MYPQRVMPLLCKVCQLLL